MSECVFGRLALLVLAWVSGFAPALAGASEKRQPRRPGVTVADTIEMRRPLSFGAPGEVLVSPDGRRYLLAVTHGDIARNGNWLDNLGGELSSLSAADPRKIVTLFTTALGNLQTGVESPIQGDRLSMQWLDDNARVAFLWNTADELTQLYTLDVTSGELQQL